ncbi:cupin domain-containing protein [Candidatus Woesearchaeota archaeon]|jgi:mannose-6-phosphate isomerase-like protein (cupin superfamily)|nr:cupin domain-containing protein [Candidatus Woesearchaeota archaeon]MBT3537834.1 cupin domain-containing protein [Candidatus Woesearchaeota archaeon]MBT4697965.1 cupin domain-containing protein [Candidatus Woesearchaeota archaeon]MBT7105503.1 cupin domain-containing protein [Candidatus Woesearchaeota archaeon]MBT7931693.1 cupin domain-containing protein [Candidatus Woesearchaeota archaeon]
MHIKKDDTNRVDVTLACVVNEYQFGKKGLGLATATINGRHPLSGKIVNEECDSMYYIISGKGIIHHETGDYEVNEGDAFYFEKGKWYWVEGENMKIVEPSAPAWFYEQHKNLED